jgi:hypothetical protein
VIHFLQEFAELVCLEILIPSGRKFRPEDQATRVVLIREKNLGSGEFAGPFGCGFREKGIIGGEAGRQDSDHQDPFILTDDLQFIDPVPDQLKRKLRYRDLDLEQLGERPKVGFSGIRIHNGGR